MTVDVSIAAASPGVRDAGPLSDAQAQLSSAVSILGYDPGLHEMLARPRHRPMSHRLPI